MTDSDDTDVLLVIPNDFFSVDEPETRESRSNSFKMSDPVNQTHSQTISAPQIKATTSKRSTAFEQYCANHMESSLNQGNVQPLENNLLLQEIDGFLSQIQQQPNRTMYCESTTSELPSLKDLWHTGGSASNSSVHKSMLEERLRRRHLEQNLEATQIELVEAQQKVSVALGVDQAKDVAIGKLRTTIKVIQQQADASKEALHEKVRGLEVELMACLESSKRLKETNALLEGKVAHLTTATNDIREINKKQLEDLQVSFVFDNNWPTWMNLIIFFPFQIRLSNSLKAEQLINDDLVRTRNQLVIERNGHRENQESWQRKEGNYKGEQETLRASLKHFYQKQLNDVVHEKLREFQKQMDDLEVQFQGEYQRRERQIAERAIEQMELIYTKNEEELRLMQEKHREEVKFVQLQLEMAQTTISEAQHRLMGYGAVGDGGGRVEGESLKKRNNNETSKTPIKRINFSATGRAHSPELQGYIDTVGIVE